MGQGLRFSGNIAMGCAMNVTQEKNFLGGCCYYINRNLKTMVVGLYHLFERGVSNEKILVV